MENRNNLVKEWISKAEHDVGMAKLALDYKPEYTDAFVFTVNKQLKSI